MQWGFGSMIIFHLSKQWKAKFFILCDVIFLLELQGEFDVDIFRSEWVNYAGSRATEIKILA